MTLRFHQLGIGPIWVRRSIAHRIATNSPNANNAVVPPCKQPDLFNKFEKLISTEKNSTSICSEDTVSIPCHDWPMLERAVADCSLCPLSSVRTRPVFGSGDKRAKLMIVGEAPGAEEDRQGFPFVGQGGKLLDNMLASIGQTRYESIFITNVLKCRPPKNRNPKIEEINCCMGYLIQQIQLIEPRLILALGRYAVNTLLKTEAPIGTLRGRLHQYKNIPVIVTYHPAYLLRNLADKDKAWQDLLLVKQTLAKIKSDA